MLHKFQCLWTLLAYWEISSAMQHPNTPDSVKGKQKAKNRSVSTGFCSITHGVLLLFNAYKKKNLFLEPFDSNFFIGISYSPHICQAAEFCSHPPRRQKRNKSQILSQLFRSWATKENLRRSQYLTRCEIK